MRLSVSVYAAGGVQKATNQIHRPGDTWKAGRNFEATFAVSSSSSSLRAVLKHICAGE